MANDYIPAKDADFALWSANFAALIGANPTTYGLTSGQGTSVTTANTAFQTAYTTAINLATRTSPAIAAKDVARSNAEVIERQIAMIVRNNPAISESLKTGLGLTIPKTTPTPIPAPTSAPQIIFVSAAPQTVTLGYRDTASPAGKAKPAGAIGVELWRSIGTSAAVDPSQTRFVGTITKSPFSDSFEAGDVGKIATYFTRFATRSGPAGKAQTGPWSAALSFNVV